MPGLPPPLPEPPPPIVAPAPEAAPTGLRAWLDGPGVTGDWGGARSFLADHGLGIDLAYTGEYFGQVRGGLPAPVGGAFHGSVDLALTLDTGKAGAWSGGKLFLLAQNEHGLGISDTRVGAMLPVSNLETTPFTQLSELWYEHKLFDGLLTLRFGKQDANRDFGSPRYGGNFINNSFGALPTMPLPSYPTPGLGGVIVVEPSRFIVLRAGAYEGSPQIGSLGFDSAVAPRAGAFTAAAVGLRHVFGPDRRHGGITNIGAWYHSGYFPEVTADPNPRDLRGNAGFTVIHDEHVYAAPKDKESTAGVHLSFRLALAQPSRSNADRYLGGSVTYHGFPWRENDTVGVGVGTLHVQRPAGGAKTDGTEVVVEAFYKARLTPWLSVEPDLQLYHRPSGDGRDAVVLGTRMKLRI